MVLRPVDDSDPIKSPGDSRCPRYGRAMPTRNIANEELIAEISGERSQKNMVNSSTANGIRKCQPSRNTSVTAGIRSVSFSNLPLPAIRST